MDLQIKPFSQLTNKELYQLIQLRVEVFCVEQNCVYQDCDNKDQDAWHLLLWDKGQLAGCLRILDKEKKFPEISIGRVITAREYRGRGLGKLCMEKAVHFIKTTLGEERIRISAQKYAKGFYESVGFVQDSGEYLEDGIMHIEMIHP